MIVIIQAQLRLWPNTSGLGKGQCKVCKVCLAGKAVKAGELSVDLLWFYLVYLAGHVVTKTQPKNIPSVSIGIGPEQ